ncbi:hypothetical protein CB1_000912013 [Camelus ferus]|nr:hypothetical protein CB1_000912013 [Camelus ferus]
MVLQEVVGHPSCMLLYGSPSLATEATEPQHVAFSSPVELELQGPRLWAQNQEQVQVYWEVSGPLGSASPSTLAYLLSWNCDTPIFDFGTFFQELGEFWVHRRRGSPHCNIYLGFGQELSMGRPKEKNLILVQLEPWLCQAFLEGVQHEDVSSLDSGSLGLCLSGSNSLSADLEHFLEHFLMEMEQPA